MFGARIELSAAERMSVTLELRFDTGGLLFLMLPIKDKYDVDKTDTSDTLKDNVPEAIGEIQLHAIG